MSWQKRDDLGLQVVGHVFDCLKVEQEWGLEMPRGFSWWADDLKQSIWSDIGMFQNSQNVFRVHSETDLFKGRGHSKDFELHLASHMRGATLSAVVYDTEADTYRLHCSAYATSDNEGFMDKLFMAASAIQVAEAHEIGHHLAKQIGAIPASTGHPRAGIRTPASSVLASIPSWFTPAGQHPSRWEGNTQWKELERAMDRQALHFESDHHSRINAGFGWAIQRDGQPQVSSLSISTNEPHPQFGNGLMCRLKLPVKLPDARVAHTAMELNNMERKEWLRCQFMGSWCFDNGELEFECFVPNGCYHSDILEAVSLSMAIRAEWVSEVFARWFSSAVH